ncbi:cutinase [Pseudomassariella vexata]|uniref:cutinase n=1 Tax=Pseudomassariella vexata TaxID=1141098 RepID=A0A1Y2DQ12_9PEZI|nr:cutinase [Pseudomassariella vexata]ORY61340.1 cutinase [Pseudomassariella vexata]
MASVGSLITKGEARLASLQHIRTVENDLVDGTCRDGDVVVIFARGTTEPGNVGQLVGPPLFRAIRKQLPHGQGGRSPGESTDVSLRPSIVSNNPPVFYPTIHPAETLVNDSESPGTENRNNRAELVTQTLHKYPHSKIVLAGYSQGAQIVHNTARLLDPVEMAAVSSVILFGDPANGQAIQNADPRSVMNVCHHGDNIACGGDLIMLPHLTYALDTDDAAAFVLEQKW